MTSQLLSEISSLSHEIAYNGQQHQGNSWLPGDLSIWFVCLALHSRTLPQTLSLKCSCLLPILVTVELLSGIYRLRLQVESRAVIFRFPVFACVNTPLGWKLTNSAIHITLFPVSVSVASFKTRITLRDTMVKSVSSEKSKNKYNLLASFSVTVHVKSCLYTQ
jgi:hypothetical protein